MAFYEYMDHPADVIIHGRGNTIAQAFEQVCIGMMNYMVPLQYVEIVPETEREVEVQGHDLENLLYTFLDEFFFIFSTDLFISKEVEILKLDESNFSIKAIGRGDIFNRSKHEQGTEIKAVTMHNMHISKNQDVVDVFVTVDI